MLLQSLLWESGLKSSFRLLVNRERAKVGLDHTATNAPTGCREELDQKNVAVGIWTFYSYVLRIIYFRLMAHPYYYMSLSYVIIIYVHLLFAIIIYVHLLYAILIDAYFIYAITIIVYKKLYIIVLYDSMMYILLLDIFIYCLIPTSPSWPVQTLPYPIACDLCASFQRVAFRHVQDRVHRAMEYIHSNGIPVRSLVVVGGVAANLQLRRCRTYNPLDYVPSSIGLVGHCLSL